MSISLTPSQLTEIRRVKSMVSVVGQTVNPSCFIGPTGPAGPSFSVTVPNAIVTIDALGATVIGDSNFTYSSTNGMFVSTLTATSILASTICTYTMVVYGKNTLIVDGGFYTSSINLRDSSGGYTSLRVNNGIFSSEYNSTIHTLTNSSNIVSTVQGLGSSGYISTLATTIFDGGSAGSIFTMGPVFDCGSSS